MKAILTIAVLALGLSASAADTPAAAAAAAASGPATPATAPAMNTETAKPVATKVAKADTKKMMEECKSENPSATKKELKKCVSAKKKAMK